MSVLEAVLKSRDMTELARPLLAAPRPFRGSDKRDTLQINQQEELIGPSVG